MLNAAVSKNKAIRENLRSYREPVRWATQKRDKAEHRNRDRINAPHLYRGEIKQWIKKREMQQSKAVIYMDKRVIQTILLDQQR